MQIEERFVGRRLVHFSSTRESYWYAFGTLLGESITRDTRTQGAWGLRYAKQCQNVISTYTINQELCLKPLGFQ